MIFENRTSALLTLVCLTVSPVALAGTQEIESANSQVNLQIQLRRVDQAETANGTVLDTEKGDITGYGLSMSAMKDLWLGHDYFDAQYSSFDGQTNYVGGTQGNPTYGSLTGKSGAKINDYSFRYGKGFVIDGEGSMVTLYGELGHHKWDRMTAYDAPGSYLETYTHNYYGIGILAQYGLIDKMVLSVHALIGRTSQSHITINLPAPFTTLSAKLGNSSLNKVGIAVDYAFTENIHAIAEVNLTSWEYGASAMQPIGGGLSAYEPDSRNNDTTFKAGLGFAF